ncbi:hypothetical protein Hokovirus_2_180 [Hokovirus HKV1]|uniref:Uncharacterized protein n=1 Tax=Hokovirus HKV1 TaxID=1977638 RepID=A0A1V0SG18_9VIRU|nr:hypothetical protein Hokovirus_2_180 [Hokovirus HKV1]
MKISKETENILTFNALLLCDIADIPLTRKMLKQIEYDEYTYKYLYFKVYDNSSHKYEYYEIIIPSILFSYFNSLSILNNDNHIGYHYCFKKNTVDCDKIEPLQKQFIKEQVLRRNKIVTQQENMNLYNIIDIIKIISDIKFMNELINNKFLYQANVERLLA